MSYSSHKSYKKFIQDFNFPDPDWDKLPSGFPDLSKEGLNLEEEKLLDAIVLAWFTTTNKGKAYLFRKVRIGLVSLIGLISLISLLSFAGVKSLSRQVQATGMILDEAIQSTMSAILKR